MKRSNNLTSFVAAFALGAGCAHAADSFDSMERCTVVGADGKGLIKAHMGACKSVTSSCAGNNEAGDPTAWILVPAGECEKINAGDFSGVNDNIKDKIDMSGFNGSSN